MIASQYHWSLNDILDLTMHELNWIIAAINKRTGREISFRASLHGMKLKNSINNHQNDAIIKELSSEDQNKLDTYIHDRTSKKATHGR